MQENEELVGELDKERKENKELEKVVGTLNDNRIHLEELIQNYRTEIERYNEELNEFSIMKKALDELKVKNFALLNKVVNEVIA